MKTKAIIAAAFTVLLAGASLSAMASTGKHTPLYGEAVPASAAQRTVTITPATKYVNVKAGETVQFIANGQSTTWYFDNPVKFEVKLRKIMPQGSLDHKVMVYIARNPDYHAN
jgi:plastocyanin